MGSRSGLGVALAAIGDGPASRSGSGASRSRRPRRRSRSPRPGCHSRWRAGPRSGWPRRRSRERSAAAGRASGVPVVERGTVWSRYRCLVGLDDRHGLGAPRSRTRTATDSDVASFVGWVQRGSISTTAARSPARAVRAATRSPSAPTTRVETASGTANGAPYTRCAKREWRRPFASSSASSRSGLRATRTSRPSRHWLRRADELDPGQRTPWHAAPGAAQTNAYTEVVGHQQGCAGIDEGQQVGDSDHAHQHGEGPVQHGAGADRTGEVGDRHGRGDGADATARPPLRRTSTVEATRPIASTWSLGSGVSGRSSPTRSVMAAVLTSPPARS